MTHVALLLFLNIALGALGAPDIQASPKSGHAVLVIHGGAGTISRDRMTPERDKAYRAALSDALLAGYRIVQNGGTSLDAVEAAIVIMEDSPLFNAGRGSVYTSDGRIEMDASIMDGKSHHAGAVASLVGVKNPIKAARLVMEKTPHVLLVGDGAIDFAREQGLEFADSAYFGTPERWEQLQRARAEEKEKNGRGALGPRDIPMGTAGALALDHEGNLAAATSTGGLTNKRWGRVGDSPIIGAGTFADNATCAVSCSGQGELFILGSYAHEVSSLMTYKGMSVEKAAKHVIHDELTPAGGKDTGGLIALDRKGNFAMELNTPGMYRGYIGEDGVPHTFLYLDE